VFIQVSGQVPINLLPGDLVGPKAVLDETTVENQTPVVRSATHLPKSAILIYLTHDTIINVFPKFSNMFTHRQNKCGYYTLHPITGCVYFWCPRTMNCSVSLTHINGEMSTASYFFVFTPIRNGITCVYEHNRLNSLVRHSIVACFEVATNLSPWKIEDNDQSYSLQSITWLKCIIC